MMHMGEMSKTFIGIGKEEQADIKPEDSKHASNVAALLGIDCEWMINYFCSKIFSHVCVQRSAVEQTTAEEG